MIKAVIFDLDGTLADSLESIAYCTNTVLQGLGFLPIEKEAFRYLVGDGAAKLVERALERSGDEKLALFDRAFSEYTAVFEKYCMYQVKPYPGIVEMLQALKEAGIRTAVLSNKPHERTKDVIRSLFGEELFDVVMGQQPGVERKPSPAGVFAILKELGLEKEETLYLGDTNTDMLTGKAAGLFTIGVLWGFRDREELMAYRADALIERPMELLDYISQSVCCSLS